MIKRIVLENFKCFDHVEIPIGRLTLLAGGNGSGKSSIIHSLLLARQSNEVGGNQLDFIGKYIKLGYSTDAFYEFNEGEPIISIEIDDENDNSTVLKAEYESYKTKLELTADSHFQGNDKGLFGSGFEFIAADRISPDRIFSIFNDRESIGIHGENVMNYLANHGTDQINPRICNDGVSNVLIAQVDFWLSKLFNGFSLRYEEVMKSDQISMRFQEVSSGDKSNERRPINVGFGITYVLPVVVALLKAREGDVVIIENPECHLHPKAQRLMGELISIVSAGGTQVIVETHSDHVLNGIRLAVKKKIINKELTQILFVAREDVGTHYHVNIYAPNILENGDLDVWPEGFFDEWDNALINLLG